MSDTPPDRTMSVRDFLRGGYKEPGGTIIVVSGSTIAGVWSPGTDSVLVKTTFEHPRLGDMRDTFRPAPKPGKKR